jgi:4-hydroxy-3-polyprenylbenzoate decarboxylase
MAFKDLREFVSALEGIHELRAVRGAEWNLEIGTISEIDYELKGPALMFDEVPGYPKGYRILANAMDTLPRALLAVGLPTDLDADTAWKEFQKKCSSYAPVPPQKVSTGPLFENVFRGAEINLWKFPTPKWHEEDGGRYIGTGCMVFMRDPDEGKINFGCYRVMVQDKTTAGLYCTPEHTGAIILRKYWKKGQNCPVAVACGAEPVMFLGAAYYLGRKPGLVKYETVGHVRGAPVEVVEEEFTGLPIPATAEIVIAGEVPPPDVESKPEGPLGEWTGYFGHGMRPEPVIRVKALYHRNEPIILGMPPFKYRGPTSHFGIPSKAINTKERLQKAGIEDVLDVWHLAIPGVIVVQIRQRYPGHAIKAGLAAIAEYMGRFVVVVDEDINPRDPEDVLWAIGTRCDPATSITTVPSCPSSALDPRIPPEQKSRGDFSSSRAILNACKPYEWMDQFPATNTASPELRKKVLEKWKDLFATKT